MPLLNKPQLIGEVTDALEKSGWKIEKKSSGHPCEITAQRPDGHTEKLIVHVWNVTPGGATRDPNEFRIQITVVKNLRTEKGAKTLLLGVAGSGDEALVIAFDASQHSHFGSSSSVQVHKHTLDAAAANGLSVEKKPLASGRAELIVASRKENFGKYVENLHPSYHEVGQGTSSVEANNVQAVNFSKPTLTDEDLKDIPAERKKALIETATWVRDQNFRKKVLHVYGHRCAVCGLQGALVQGSHITAVHKKGTDEVRNGLALCANHHTAFDKGLIGIDAKYVIRVNVAMEAALRKAGLAGGLKEFFQSSRVGERIYLPAEEKYNPDPEYLEATLQTRGKQNFK